MSDRELSELRSRFEAKVLDLVGRTVSGVDYWDVHNFGPDPAKWDYGDWHHAVMGVQLTTDRRPVTLTWTNTFYPYGIEVFHDPIEEHLRLGDSGPERVGPDGDDMWPALMGRPIRGATIWWDRLELGPARVGDEVVEPARSIDLPTAIRLDIGSDRVWFVAGIPQWPEMEDVFIPGDEIMVIFSPERMRNLRLGDASFVS